MHVERRVHYYCPSLTQSGVWRKLVIRVTHYGILSSFFRLTFIFSFLCISESVSRRHFPCSLLFPLFPTCASFLFGLENNGEPLTPADTVSCFVYLKPLHNTAAISFFVRYTFFCAGHAVAQLVEARRYKSGDRGFDSRWCHWNFSLT